MINKSPFFKKSVEQLKDAAFRLVSRRCDACQFEFIQTGSPAFETNHRTQNAQSNATAAKAVSAD